VKYSGGYSVIVGKKGEKNIRERTKCTEKIDKMHLRMEMGGRILSGKENSEGRARAQYTHGPLG
jgi:hypothetical protein